MQKKEKDKSFVVILIFVFVFVDLVISSVIGISISNNFLMTHFVIFFNYCLKSLKYISNQILRKLYI